MPILSSAKSYACAIFSLSNIKQKGENLHPTVKQQMCLKRSAAKNLLVARQLSFGLSDIREVALPQVNVQNFHKASLK